MSLNHRRLSHVPCEVEVQHLKTNLKLYSDEFIKRIKEELSHADDGCYTSLQNAAGTSGLVHPVFVFQGRCFAGYAAADNRDKEIRFVQDLETGEWMRCRKIQVSASGENNTIAHDDLELLLRHKKTKDEFVRHLDQHVHFFNSRAPKQKIIQRQSQLLMLHPGMMVAQDEAKKKSRQKPDGDYLLFTKMIPGMTLSHFINMRQHWPVALKLNITIMLVSLLADLQKDNRQHGHITAENVMFDLQKKLDKLIRLQVFGVNAAADEVVKQLRADNAVNEITAIQSDCIALGEMLQGLWDEADLPHEIQEGLDGLIGRLLGQSSVNELNLLKEVELLCGIKSSMELPVEDTCLPVYLLKVSEYLKKYNAGRDEFKAFCSVLKKDYLSVRLFECEGEDLPALDNRTLMHFKQTLEREGLIVSDKVYAGTYDNALEFMLAKNHREPVNGMQFVFNTEDRTVEESVVPQAVSCNGEDVRLLIGEEAEEVRRYRRESSEYDGDSESETETEVESATDDDDESDDIVDAVGSVLTEFGARLASCCLNVFRPNRRAQLSLDASPEAVIHIQSDTAWEQMSRNV